MDAYVIMDKETGNFTDSDCFYKSEKQDRNNMIMFNDYRKVILNCTYPRALTMLESIKNKCRKLKINKNFDIVKISI